MRASKTNYSLSDPAKQRPRGSFARHEAPATSLALMVCASGATPYPSQVSRTAQMVVKATSPVRYMAHLPPPATQAHALCVFRCWFLRSLSLDRSVKSSRDVPLAILPVTRYPVSLRVWSGAASGFNTTGLVSYALPEGFMLRRLFNHPSSIQRGCPHSSLPSKHHLLHARPRTAL